MQIKPNSFLGRFLQRRSVAQWKTAARAAEKEDLTVLRTRRQYARELRAPMQELIHVADSRLAVPREGSTLFPRPPGTDWSWRPQAWRAGLADRGIAPATNKTFLGDELAIFHDCKVTEIAFRQDRNRRNQDLAAFGVSIEVFAFDGNFLSLVVDLPQDVCEGLRKRHLIRLSAHIETEAPLTVLARLNVKHGPNTAQDLQTLPMDNADVMVEFDLSAVKLNETRVSKVWVDLMLQNPQMNQITIRDLNFARYPRAEI